MLAVATGIILAVLGIVVLFAALDTFTEIIGKLCDWTNKRKRRFKEAP
jgi:hypothetical protein